MDKQMVYYPGFEPIDTNWLKFSLLYFDKVTPIIPYSGDSHLSDTFREVLHSTDLFEPLRPTNTEGANATADALSNVEGILKNPERFKHIFNSANIPEEWRTPNRHVVKLFSDKYTDDWERFCIENQLGQRDDHGLKISRSLTDVYMTVLAHTISDARGISPITDDTRLNDYGLFVRKKAEGAASSARLQLAQGVLSLKAPRLQEISLEQVMRFRNDSGVEAHRRQFNKSLDAYMSAFESDIDPNQFLNDLNGIYGEFTDQFSELGVGVVSLGLSVLIAVNSLEFDGLQFAGQLAGAASLSVTSLISARNAWKNTKVKRYARRYLTNVGNLN